MSAQLTAKTRAAVRARSAGICEGCGAARACEMHHRRPRGAGGTSRTDRQGPAWVLDLCSRCHAWAESYREAARERGWLLEPDEDAELVPALLRSVYGAGRWLLEDCGLMRFQGA